MTTAVPHVSVCICTYQRPLLLKRLLSELARQDTDGQFTYSVVVADNDLAQSAKDVVFTFAGVLSLPVTYCVETEQNIALARNAALQNATGDYVAFLDDDEWPEGDWLRKLYEACERFQADGVLGPVKPRFEEEPPAWVRKGRFYERPTHPTGFVIDWNEGRTGNLLLRKRILAGVSLPFRPEFGSGGEDRDFFRRMIAAGCVFIWCDEAVAYEVVPSIRWKRSFLLRRALLRGKASLSHRSSRVAPTVRSLAAIPLYAVALPFAFFGGQHRFMDCLIRLCDHLGRVLGLLGLNPIKENYITE